MTAFRTLQYRVQRRAGRLLTWVAALGTLGAIPPFVSTSAVIVEGDSVLVVIDPIRAEPVLPGGHLRWREGPREAAVREVREETGYTVRLDGLLAIVGGEEWTGEAGIVRVVYTATITGGSLCSSGEGEAVWRNVKDVQLTAERDAPLLRLWCEAQESERAGD